MSQYGTIIEIRAKSTQKMKGQAFVVFEDIVSANTAMEELNGMNFFGQKLDIQFAKTTSHVVMQ